MSGNTIEHDGLQLRLLGELEVVVQGRVLPLPQSRKTRALLGYLALSGRAHRRERLCALFWDVADDPRAALRWSLSKLRELVDTGRPRLIADREHASLELGQAYVDAHEVQRLLGGELEAAPTANLETARARFRGELLEGLELPDFHAYQAWLLSERRVYRELQRRVLTTLLQRTGRQPEQALPLVRELVHLDPSDETARSQLQELLHATGKFREAEEQSRANRRLLHSEPPPVPDSGKPQRVVVSSREELPFVGRAAEREHVRAWRRAAQPELRLALVLGDAGLGKSRLLRELAQDAAAEGARVVAVAAHESRPGWPYAPFRELLRALEAASPALEPLLADDSSSPPTAAGRERLFRAVCECLERAAQAAGALTIVLDDVHWLDDGSAELLEFLATELRGARVEVLLGAREGELRDAAGVSRVLRGLRRRERLEELRLAPLTRDETLQLVAPIARGDTAQLYEHCAGNALFAIELAREPLAEGRTPAASISRLIRDRLDALSPEQCDVLRWAAVLGDQFETELLGRLIGMESEALLDALERLERYGWVTFEAGSGAFVHEIVRRAVYDQLSEPRRRLMHGRVARALAAASGTDGELAAAVAHHAVLAGDRAMGAQACLRAGQRCLRVYGFADAYNLGRRGLSYARELADPERTKLSLELLTLLTYARRPESLDEVMPELIELTARALDLGLLEQARSGFYLRAFLLWERGEDADVVRFSREVERLSRAGDPRERTLALCDAARCLAMLERDLPEAEAFLLEAEAVAPKLEELPLALPLTRGILSLHRGELPRAQAELERALSLAQRESNRLQQFLALEFRINLELVRKQYGVALALATELVGLAERLRGGTDLPYSRALQALLQYATDPDATPDAFDAALQPLALEDAKQRQALLLSHAAELERSRSAWPLAVRHAEAALKLATAMERQTEAAIAQSVLAAAELASQGRVSAPRTAALDALLEQPISDYARGLVRRLHDNKERRDGARHRRASVR